LKVLRRVAKQGGMTLIMKQCPAGEYSRSDARRYTVPDAVRILNRELEPSGFRLIEQHEFLLVLNVDDLRSGYSKPALVRHRSDDNDSTASGVRPAGLETSSSNPPVPEEGLKEVDDGRLVRLMYLSAAWPRALNDFAKDAGLTLVMKRCPNGTFHHPDMKKYTVPDAIAVLNSEMDQTGFRLVRQGNFLIVLDLQDIRSEYQRPTVGKRRRRGRDEAAPDGEGAPLTTQTEIVPVSASDPETSRLEPAALESFEPALPLPLPPTPLVSPSAAVVGTASAKDESAGDEKEDVLSAMDATTVFAPQHGRIEPIAKRLYKAVKARSELVESGPEGLPSFRVYSAAPVGKDKDTNHASKSTDANRSRLRFTVGIDTDRNRLVVEAAPQRRSAVVRLFERLDSLQGKNDDDLKLVSADTATTAIAQNLAPELNRLVAQRDTEDSMVQVAPAPTIPNPRAAGQPGSPPTDRSVTDIVKGLKGDVTVESVPELGILILRGGQADVDAVMRVIRDIEKLSAGAAPQIHVLNLQYVNSESFAKLLDSVYSALHGLRTGEKEAKQPIRFFAIVKPNAVLVIAPPADMPSVLDLAKKLDRPVNPETEFQVFPLHHGYAAQVARAVTDFFKGREGLGTKVVAIPDARTNSIIAQARPSDLNEVGRLIEKLDGPTASQATLKVFTLINGDASTIQKLLDALFVTPGGQRPGANGATQTDGTSESAPTTLRLSVDVRTNSIIAVGSPDTLRAVEAVILRLDSLDAHQRKTVVIRLKNNSAQSVQAAVDAFVRSQRDVAQIDPELISNVELLEREVFIVAEPNSNSLMLSATPRFFEELQKIIEKLDAPPTQIIIQALIVEVTLNNDDEFGIELGFQSPVLFDRSNIGTPVTFQTTSTLNPTTTIANNVILSEPATPGFQITDPTQGLDGLGQNVGVNKSQVGTQEISQFGLGRISNTLGYGGLVLSASSESVSALLRAVSQTEKVHVLSRPQIRTVDNQVATIQVGKQVPIVNGFFANATGSLSPIVTQQPAGIILTVQPRIDKDGMIVMHAYAEKSAFESGGVVLVTDSTTGRTITSPIKDITRAETTVSLASGNTVVMGGMITTSDDAIQRKVPWAGDLPVVGQLFRYDTRQTVRTELLIFLTPRLIRDDGDDEMIKQIETERLHFLVDEAESIHGPILSTKPPFTEDGTRIKMPPLLAPPAELPPAPTPPPAPKAGLGFMPEKPGRTQMDNSNVPTTTMPPTADHDIRLLPSQPSDGKPVSQRGKSGDQAGAVRNVSFEERAGDSEPVAPSNGAGWLSGWSSAQPSRSP